MQAFLIGILGGLIELFLLRLLVKALGKQQTGLMALVSLLKLLVLVLTFTIVVLFFREDLIWCGVGLGMVLVGGSFIQFLIAHKKEGA